MWVFSALLLAALITPFLYDAGKALASSAAVEELPGILEWLGAASGRAKLGRFFSRSLMASAVLLLPVLFWRLRAMATGGPVPLVRLPARAVVIQVLTGLLIAGGLLWGMGLVIAHLGAYVPDSTPPPSASC